MCSLRTQGCLETPWFSCSPSYPLLLLPAASWHLHPRPEESTSYDSAPSPPPERHAYQFDSCETVFQLFGSGQKAATIFREPRSSIKPNKYLQTDAEPNRANIIQIPKIDYKSVSTVVTETFEIQLNILRTQSS